MPAPAPVMTVEELDQLLLDEVIDLREWTEAMLQLLVRSEAIDRVGSETPVEAR